MPSGKGKGHVAQHNQQAAREHAANQEAKRAAEEAEKVRAEALEKATEASRRRVQHAITIATAIVSLCALGVALWQGYESKKGVDAQVRATEAQVKATNLQYRPWLALKEFLPPRLDGSADDSLTFVISNAGPLPARGNWYCVLRTGYVKDWEKRGPDYSDIWGNTTMSNTTNYPFVMPASQSTNMKLSLADIGGVAPEVRSGIADGTMMPIVCIRIDYRGPEVDDPLHVYRACMFRNLKTHLWEGMFAEHPLEPY